MNHRALLPVCMLLTLPLGGCTLLFPMAAPPLVPVSGRIALETGTGPHAPMIVHLTARDPARLEASTDRSLISLRRDRIGMGIVRPGQAFSFFNEDATHHELFSLERSHAFRAQVPAGKRSEPIASAHPGLVVLFCKLHPAENHWILVSTASYHAVVDESGQFEFPGVPAGVYRLGVTGVGVDSYEREIAINESVVRDLYLDLSGGG